MDVGVPVIVTCSAANDIVLPLMLWIGPAIMLVPSDTSTGLPFPLTVLKVPTLTQGTLYVSKANVTAPLVLVATGFAGNELEINPYRESSMKCMSMQSS